MDALEAIGSARSMRYLLPTSLPDGALERLIWAATRASSAHNSQPWQFIVVQDAALRARLGDLVRDAVRAADPLPPQPATRTDRLIDAGVRHLFEHLGEAPAIVLVCGANIYPPGAPNERFLWSALDSAAQNLIIAARALGLGAANTMLHTLAEPAVRSLLGVPENMVIGATIPVGHPARGFGEVRRKPVADVLHVDHW